jgi:hypothetical protein
MLLGCAANHPNNQAPSLGTPATAQLYRDRADAENGCDELKNQWGWGGFATRDIGRCQTSARAVAPTYNWRSWHCRAAKPEARMEAIASRALPLAAVGRSTKQAVKTTLCLTPMHAAKSPLMLPIADIRAAPSCARRVAQQSPTADRWKQPVGLHCGENRPSPTLLSCSEPAPGWAGNCRL